MPKSVQITTPWPSFEEMVGHLHVPEARQKELSALAEEIWKRLSAEEQATADDTARREEKPRNASAAD